MARLQSQATKNRIRSKYSQHDGKCHPANICNPGQNPKTRKPGRKKLFGGSAPVAGGPWTSNRPSIARLELAWVSKSAFEASSKQQNIKEGGFEVVPQLVAGNQVLRLHKAQSYTIIAIAGLKSVF